MDIAAKLKMMREEADKTQADMKEAIGVARSQISKIENGEKSTPYQHIVQWADTCGYDLVFQKRDHPTAAALAAELTTLEVADLIMVRRLFLLLRRLSSDDIHRNFIEDLLFRVEQRLKAGDGRRESVI